MKAMIKVLLGFCAIGLLGASLTSLSAFSAERNCDTEIHVDCGSTPHAVFVESDAPKQPQLWVVFVQNDHVFFTVSNDFGGDYTTPVKVNSTPDTIYTNGENRPKVAVGDQGEIYISWTQKTEGRYAGDIRFSRSLNQGKTFSETVTINNDGLLTSHRFDSLHVAESGKVYIAWLDKRDQVAVRKSGGEYDGAALYFAISDDSGENFLNPETLENYRVANNSCECCRIAIESHGEDDVAVVWRHIFGDNTRDHAYGILKSDGSSTFGRATFDNWQIDACPHHGPDMLLDRSVVEKDQYHIVWFSNGDDHKGIYYGLHDFTAGGESQVYSVDDSPGASHPQIAATNIRGQDKSGRGKIYIAWKSFDGEKTHIKLVESSDNGASWIDKGITMSASGDSDHPLLLIHDDNIYLAWATEEEGYRVAPIN
jgi:hypothetical protein